ncbi:MAG: pyruvate dehydrogenase complex dihydrolipoamide acetyltransferase [Alphaproteobacteria bacterium]|nr:pyruvate dehydrogenase complex dihydrolipoamide acetyltransferase [Alphaproteobacteria bacterium]
MEVEAVDEGVLGKIIVAEGTENVPVNDVIAVLLEDGESADDISSPSLRANKESEAIQSVSEPENKPDSGLPRQLSGLPRNDVVQKGGRVFASPLAKRLAADRGIDLSAIKGSGPRGRIIRDDVMKGSGDDGKSASPHPVITSSPHQTNIYGMAYREIPNNNIKKVTAKRLTESKQSVPHFYLSVECALDNLLAARKELNDKANGEYKLSVNDFIIKAAAMALKAYPAANVSWTDEAIHQYLSSDISVAVATPNGLITPIVKAAETKGLRAISDEVKELAARARDGKLAPEEFQGGSFTISNLGMFGVKEFAAILNPPQSCILAVGAGEQMPRVVNGEIKIQTVMCVSLSTDHRSVDGAVGAQWLQVFKRYIENPVSMLV